MAADWIRCGYEARMRVYNNKDPIPVTWYVVPNTTPFLPIPSVFVSRYWVEPKGNDGIGEQYDYDCCGIDYRPRYRGGPAHSYLGTSYCGPAIAWDGLATYPDVPSLIFDPSGRAICCPLPWAEWVGGQQEGGTFPAHGGAVVAWSGGQQEGGTWPSSTGISVTWAGGQQEGGSWAAVAGALVAWSGGQQEGGTWAAAGGTVVAWAGGQQEGGSWTAGGHNAPSQRAFSNSGNQVGTWTATKPTGTASGDIVVAFLFTSGTATLPTSVSGVFTRVGNQTFGTTNSLTIWTRTATGSEPAYQFVTAAGAQSSYVLVAIKNVTAVENGSNVSTGTGTTITANAITPSFNPNYLLCAMAWNSLVAPPTTPAGMAVVASGGTTIGAMRVFDQTTTSSGSTGTRSGTISSTTWAACLLDSYH